MVTGWKRKIVGISDASIDLTGFGQQAGHTLDQQLYNMLGAPATTTAMEIDTPTSGVGDIRYTFAVFLKSYNIDLKVADAYKLTASFSVNGSPTRALIAS